MTYKINNILKQLLMNKKLKLNFDKSLPRFKFGPKVLIRSKAKQRTVPLIDILAPFSYEEKWNSLDWSVIRRSVFSVQERIYALRKANKIDEMISLQLELVSSLDAKFLAVRRVTQDNMGKVTAGVDGMCRLLKSQRYSLALNHLGLSPSSASPIRRVWIPKPGTAEKRPLGIPTIFDRAKQALVKLALEPEWEAVFEPHSFGFRPGRNCHDALKQIRTSLIHSPKFVYDADVRKCFDTIDHDALLAKLSQVPGNEIYDIISMWLKAGIMEDVYGPFPPYNPMGTPQGGIVSPLLANIALHGLENAVHTAILRHPFLLNKVKMSQQTKVIRYADDFVILAPTRAVLDVCIHSTAEFLSSIGLEISVNKTRVLHTLNKALCPDGNNKFKFLGMIIYQIPVGKYRAGKASGGRRVLWSVRVLPHPKKVKSHFDSLRSIIKSSSSAFELIVRANPVIRGWRNYFSKSDGATAGLVGSLNRRLYLLVSNWAKRVFKTRKRVSNLWKTVGTNKWTFYSVDPSRKKERYLLNYDVSWSLVQYESIRVDSSPFDGNFEYWLKRGSRATSTRSIKSRLFKRQTGLCPLCKLPFNPGIDLMEIDHIIPKSSGGTDSLSNLQLLHKECHSSKSSAERKSRRIQFAE